MNQLTVPLLTFVLLPACEGGGTSSADHPLEPLAREAGDRLLDTAALPPEDIQTEENQETIVDLGLVDPCRAVRIDVASNGYGTLSVEQFSVALIDENPAVRQAAIDALIGAPEQILRGRLESLKYALTDPDESVRESVVAVLAGLNDPRSVALLLKAHRDSSPLVREEAREALAGLRAASLPMDEEILHSGD